MLLGIDHVVIAVPDLVAAAHELEESVGIAATGGGRHPALGTANRLVWLGDTYVELVTIVDEVIAASSWLGRPVAAALAGCGASTRRSERLRRVRIQRLIARGSAEVQRSPAIVAAFSFDANKLGGSLFVEQP